MGHIDIMDNILGNISTANASMGFTQLATFIVTNSALQGQEQTTKIQFLKANQEDILCGQHFNTDFKRLGGGEAPMVTQHLFLVVFLFCLLMNECGHMTSYDQ